MAGTKDESIQMKIETKDELIQVEIAKQNKIAGNAVKIALADSSCIPIPSSTWMVGQS